MLQLAFRRTDVPKVWLMDTLLILNDEVFMQNTTVSVISEKQVVQSFDISNRSISIKATPNLSLAIQDAKTKKSPKSLHLRKKGNSLVIKTDESDDTHLLIEDYFTTDNVEIIGIQDGDFATYGLNSSYDEIGRAHV